MRLFVLLTTWVKFGSTIETPVDCNLPACSTDNCDVVQVDCERTCTNGVFGGTEDGDCLMDNKIMEGSCDNSACGSVVDCVLDACPDDTCGGKEITCTRTCNGANFGEPGCPADQENKMVTCPVKSCTDCFQACSTTDCTPKEFKCNDANDNEITKSCGFAECGNVATNTATDGYNVWCTQNGMHVVVRDSTLINLGIDPTTTSVKGDITPPCQRINYSGENSFVYYFLPLSIDCGTTAGANDIIIVFKNTVKAQPKTESGISRGSAFELNAQCTFDSHENVQIGGITPMMRTFVAVNTAEQGNFALNMALYESDNFQKVQPADFDIEVPDKLFGQVKTENTQANIVTRLKRCWATPTADVDVDARPDFIKDFQAVDGEKATITAALDQFTLESFNWEIPGKDYDTIFLNCEVLICDTELEDCIRPTGRRRRSVYTAEDKLTSIQIGPIGI